MKLIIGKDVKPAFYSEWKKFVFAIIEYAKTSGKKALSAKVTDLETGLFFFFVFFWYIKVI